MQPKHFPDWLHRSLLFLAPVGLLLFTAVFFGPLDIVNSNLQYLTITGGDILFPLLGLFLAGTLLLSALGGLLRGRALGIVWGLFTALAVLLYLQGNFLNGQLATLTGEDYRWQDNTASAIVNLLVWLLVAGGFVFLALRFEELFRTIGCILCCALILGQGVSLLSTWNKTEEAEHNWQLSGEGDTVLSSKENILVITLDQVSPQVFEQALELDPALEETFQDFLYYDNMSSEYFLTFPSLCYLLTNESYDGSSATADYMAEAWSSERCENFYNTLHEQGYDVRLYVEANYAAYTAENMLGKADNVVDAGSLIPSVSLLKNCLYMSFYRYFPFMAKNSFCVSTGGIVDLAEFQGAEVLRINENFHELVEEGLSLQSETNSFTWYHLKGAHFPFAVGYDGLPLRKQAEETDENRLIQLHGYLVQVENYLAQMKELGIYDDATIIISADHGYYDCFEAAFLIKLPGQSFETMQLNSAPVSQEDVMPTLLYCLDADYSDYGTSVFDWSEEDERERCTTIWGHSDSCPEAPWVGNLDQWDNTANGGEHYNALGRVYYTGDRTTLQMRASMWLNFGLADEILPLTDSFY